MANDTVITIAGNLAADPETRTLQNGQVVTNFRVLSTPSYFDKNTGNWVDRPTLGLKVEAWRGLAENAANTLKKGMGVVVTGRLMADEFTDKTTGERRFAQHIEADDIGVSLKRATAQVQKTQRQGAQQAQGQPQQGFQAQAPAQGYQGQQQQAWGAGGANTF